ncbi:hypothetical protein THAOC_17375 [Thalassiosira oceanica]|uniref:Uncharacterized protein n=1 Tax=Thalassiosira oceanica TaxID=159749 RepID=K0S7B1_THAOC|nr:hypothetical protein THAOC_17375 [Thalassiosira oceanica]|eukprot:EJK62033.1 hypothetical protein THAOC_17375 [Thalassiosira oceanica]
MHDRCLCPDLMASGSLEEVRHSLDATDDTNFPLLSFPAGLTRRAPRSTKSKTPKRAHEMTLTVCVGASGSGKTTFLNDVHKSHKCTYIRQYHNLRPYIAVSSIPNFDPNKLPYWDIYVKEKKDAKIIVGGTLAGQFSEFRSVLEWMARLPFSHPNKPSYSGRTLGGTAEASAVRIDRSAHSRPKEPIDSARRALRRRDR